MKSTGIVRRVDELGRVVIPVELRRTLNIDKRDQVEIFVNGEGIVLRKYEPACVFCGKTGHVISFREKTICEACFKELQSVS